MYIPVLVCLNEKNVPYLVVGSVLTWPGTVGKCSRTRRSSGTRRCPRGRGTSPVLHPPPRDQRGWGTPSGSSWPAPSELWLSWPASPELWLSWPVRRRNSPELFSSFFYRAGFCNSFFKMACNLSRSSWPVVEVPVRSRWPETDLSSNILVVEFWSCLVYR